MKTKELINSFGITESLFIMKTVENVIWGGSISGNLFVFKQVFTFLFLNIYSRIIYRMEVLYNYQALIKKKSMPLLFLMNMYGLVLMKEVIKKN